MRNLFALVCSLMLATSVISKCHSFSADNDMSEMQLRLKIMLLPELPYNSDSDYYREFLKVNLLFDTLKSSGFCKEIQFFQIVNNGYEMKSNKRIYKYLDFAAGKLIFAYNLNNGEVYRLRGFTPNDFSSLYNYINSNNNLTRGTFLTKREFFRTYNVVGVDLKCLFKAMKSNEKFDCIQKKPFYR